MVVAPVRYRSGDEDSSRWLDFELRDDDIVISTRSKSGTTWMQMVCALLVFRSPDLPRPLPELSPWLDWLAVPVEEMFADLESQPHRRFIKTHTPLDGLPLDRRVTYIVVGRHPLDAAVSLYHQSHNIDRQRLAELAGNPELSKRQPLPSLQEWLATWVESDVAPADGLDSFNGFFHHLADAWRRQDEPNVLLVHYADLLADLGGEMRRISTALGMDPGPELIDELAKAASFDSMRASSERLAPDPSGVLKDKAHFFRSGRSGEGAEALDDEHLTRYLARAGAAAPQDLLEWLHRA
jgi:hypothetical protein